MSKVIFSILQLAVLSALSTVATSSFYPERSLVEIANAPAFEQAMRENRASLVAFVNKDCETCAEFGKEFSRAALGLYPYISLYSVDCDSEDHHQTCIDHGVNTFPKVKFFPRGDKLEPLEWDESKEKSASGFYHWATLSIPHDVKKYATLEAVNGWVEENVDRPRALLLNTSPKIPLLWQTVANEFADGVVFGSHRDRRGKSSKALGFGPTTGKDTKIVFYPVGERKPVLFEGFQKLDTLTPIFSALASSDSERFEAALALAKSEAFVPDERELEIQSQQELEKMKLAHGGFSEMAEFEEAVKNAGGAGYHGAHGHGYGHHAAQHGFKGEHGHGSQQEEKTQEPSTSTAAQEDVDARKITTGMPKTSDGGHDPNHRRSEAVPTAEALAWMNKRSEL